MEPQRTGRRTVLQAALVTGAGAALAGGWRWRDRSAAAQTRTGLDVLNLALSSELTQAAAYQAALDGGALEDRDRATIEAMLAEAQRNSALIRQAIVQQGAQPIDDLSFTFPPDDMADRQRALQLLLDLENLGTSGWIGAQDLTTDAAAVDVGVALFAGKARRAAALGMLLGDPAAPFAGAFEAGMPLPQVLSALQPYRGGAR
jgi:hypothetical protein